MGYGLEGSFALAQQYANEQLNKQNNDNKPTKTVSFDGGIYSVPSDCVNGQISDVVVKGLTLTNLLPKIVVGSLYNSPENSSVIYIQTNGTIGTSASRWLIPQVLNDVIFVYLKLANNSTTDITTFHFNNGTGAQSKTPLSTREACARYTVTGNEDGYIRMKNSVAGNVVLESAMYINMTKLGIAHLTEEQVLAQCRQGHFDGTKSTVSNIRLMSDGKNKFNENAGKLNDYFLNGSTGQFTAGAGSKSIITKTSSGKQYTLSKNGGNRSVYGFFANYPKSGDYPLAFGTNDVTSAAPFGAKYLVWYVGNVDVLFPTNIMVNEGATVLPYEPYKLSQAYINAGGELRSLNFVNDEVSIGQNGTVKTQRISGEAILKSTDISSLLTSDFVNVDAVVINNNVLTGMKDLGIADLIATKLSTSRSTPLNGNTRDNLASVWKHYLNAANWAIIVPKGHYANLTAAQADLAGTALTYQLNQVVTTKLPQQPPLQVFEGGTIYVEPISDPSETTLPTVELTLPVGQSNRYGIATHDYQAAVADWVLTSNESKCMLLVATNAGAAAKIIAPTTPSFYVINNKSGQTITIKTATSTGVTIATGKTAQVMFNGTDYIKITGEV